MFLLVTDPADQFYLTSVRVDFPGDGLKKTSNTFKAKFRRLTQTQYDDVHQRLRDGSLTDSALINEVMIGWEGVSDANGNPADFNQDNLDALLDKFPTRPAIVRAYLESTKLAPSKN